MTGLRQAQKERTRQALLDAALRLLEHQSLSTLGIREVTREVGVAPAAFYRHFGDIEELGVALVEQSFESLRFAFDDLGVAQADSDLLMRQAVDVLAGHVRRHAAHFRFLARERYGGLAVVRRAIHEQVRWFADRLSGELAARPGMERWDPGDVRMLAELIVNHLISAATAILEAEQDPPSEQRAVYTAYLQLRLISVGRSHWTDQPQSDRSL